MTHRAKGRQIGARLFLMAVAAALSGCATSYRLDNTVQTFSGLQAAPASLSYRFERLPSQAAAPEQATLEALADPALFRAGLKRDDAQPRYSVQVAARVQPMLSPWADPWDPGWGWGGGWSGVGLGYGHRRGLGVGLGFGAPFPRMEQPWYHREVSVVMRELATNRVVYETRAINDGPWLDSNAVLSAMFDAALQGFPNPPVGARRVDVMVGGAPRPATAEAATPASVAPAPVAPIPAPAPSPAR